MLRTIAVLALLAGLYACTTTGNPNSGTTGQVENSGGAGGDSGGGSGGGGY